MPEKQIESWKKVFPFLNDKAKYRSKELFYSVSWGKLIRPLVLRLEGKIVVLLLKHDFLGMLKYI